MPSMIVCRCACGSAKRATTGCSACATGCCGVPSYAAATSRRHHASFARATSGSLDLVDDVVDLAAERVQRDDPAAPFRRQEQEAVVEARAAVRGLLLAVVVGRHLSERYTPAAVAAGRPRGFGRTGDAVGSGNPAAAVRTRPPGRGAAGRGRRAPTARRASSRGRPAPGAPGTRRRRRRRCGRAPAAAGEHAADLERARATAALPEQRPPRFQQRARAAGLEGHQRAEPRVGLGARDRVLGHAEARQVLLRQVHAALRPVDADVLPEVGVLQRAADRVAGGEVGRRVGAPQAQQQPADGVGRTARVVGEVGEGRVAGRDHVLAERRQQVVERRQRQIVGADRRGELGERRRGRGRTRSDGVQRGAVAVERREPLGRRGVALVGEVVGAAREAIDREHGGARRARQQAGCDGKVFVVAGGHGEGRAAVERGMAVIGRRGRGPGAAAAVRRGCCRWVRTVTVCWPLQRVSTIISGLAKAALPGAGLGPAPPHGTAPTTAAPHPGTVNP